MHKIVLYDLQGYPWDAKCYYAPDMATAQELGKQWLMLRGTNMKKATYEITRTMQYENKRSGSLWRVAEVWADVNMDLPAGKDSELMYKLTRQDKWLHKYVWQHELDKLYNAMEDDA